jgi:uncharacterized protein (TIGR03437 family)
VAVVRRPTQVSAQLVLSVVRDFKGLTITLNMKPGWIALALFVGLWPAAAQQYTIATVAGGAPPATPVSALGTSIGGPRRVALDKAGNLYFTSLNSVFKLDPSGVLTLIAGNSRPGYSGDGGPATAATLNNPEGVAVDGSGNIYVADSSNSVVRVVSPAGMISTFAGTGIPGFSGDFGQAAAAQLTLPSGLAFDGAGNLYVADTGNSVIRQITPGGIITTFAGTSFQGYVGDTAVATSAALSIPTDVAVDSKGNVYIADTGNNVIREVTTDGNINTIIGNGTNGYSGDSLVANTAQLNGPRGVVVDSSGNVYIADFDNSAIRKATPNSLTPTVTTNLNGTTTTTFNTNSIITTVAGNGTSGFTGDGNTAGNTTEFAGPWGIALDSGGNIYVADVFNARIRKIVSGGSVSTIAGNGLLSFSGDGSAATKAQLFAPRGVAADTSGNLYIADTSNNRVRKVAPGGVITTVAGNGTAGFGGDGAAAAGAQLNQPVALAIDSFGNLYIADFSNQRVRMVSPGGVISTVAGNGTAGFGGDGGAATAAQLNGPIALTVDRGGNVYVSDFNNSRVRKFTPGGNITTVAGNGINGFGGDGASATSALLNGPSGLAVDSAGNLYIADLDNSRIRKVSPTGTITTFAGNGIAAIGGDGGPVSQATLAAPQSLLIDSEGNLYVGDSVGRVRMISASGTITTIVGKGPAGYSGDGGDASLAQINGPLGLAMDTKGNLYIADTGNNAIRQAQPAGVKPTITAITNAASNATQAIAPGELVTIYGSGLGPIQLTPFALGANGRVPSSLAGTQIFFDGIAAPILYAWTNQVGVVVPFGVSGNVKATAQNGNQTSAALTMATAAAAPALFTVDFSGKGQAVANNANGSRNSAVTPAAVGSVITLIGTGGGPTSPGLPDGALGMGMGLGSPVPQLAAPVTVTIGGQTAHVTYAGAAPGIVAGVMQINVTIPAPVSGNGIPLSGNVPVVISVAGVSSPAGVTIAVSN